MENKNNAVATTTQEKNITEDVLNRVRDLRTKGDLRIPQNYSAENALKSAYLILTETVNKDKKPVLQTCSKASIANTLLDMVIQGLSPAKKQCYFVSYGDKLQLMRSYMGTVAVTKRLNGVKDVKAYCIYEGDEFETEFDIDTATLKITKFNPKFENIDMNKIKGAFAVILGDDDPIHIEIMNMNQIKAAWNQGYAKGGSGAHKNFTDEMAKKTVINRACKMFANTSDDSDILIDAFNKSDKAFDEEKTVNNVDYEVHEEIKENANTTIIDVEPQKQEFVKADNENKEETSGQVNILETPGF
ncbi:recombinase RecT [Clostridium magnum]|uniref:Recombination and repair protein RecT n=1 Tax=Clostridium magnum DSM 2767 TaxID=1121326 RepID=A0A162QFV1_9CLOT|nr:RecT family recombinase [Clostridium magnum]KZL88493.1 recombination and repair protein RecT [Clostridium magnum DSM 2767]SHJ11653.1 recombination protein RecT [Clostridium magnum DSM 2767]